MLKCLGIAIIITLFQIYSARVNGETNAIYLGCFIDYPLRKSHGYSFNDLWLTPERCFQECNNRALMYAALNRNECYCTRQTQLLTDKAEEKDCNSFCTGAYIPCGGMQKLSVYYLEKECKKVQNKSPPVFLGCYKNSSEESLSYSTLKPVDCIQQCQDDGYLFAGLQEENLCYCGNSQPIPTEVAPSSYCSANCNDPESKELKCGLKMSNGIYAVNECIETDDIYSKRQPYEGCYSDKSEHLFSFNTLDASLSVEDCFIECTRRGYTFAALQAGQSCLCGNNPLPLVYKVDDTSCNFSCIGDNWWCGGKNVISVYYMNQTCTEVRPADQKEVYLGCYMDQSKRKLSGYYFSDSDMTPEKCIAKCQSLNYLYAGLQFYSQCYCGNEKQLYVAKTPEKDCDQPCKGNDMKMCGGDFRNSVYQAGVCVEDKLDITTQNNFLGCFKYISSDTLVGHSFITPWVTFEVCAEECVRRGFKYAGIQNAERCLCGSNHMPFSFKAPEEDCNKFCTHSVTPCGGNDTFNLYNVMQNCPAVVPVSSNKYLGCYMDQRKRKLNGYYITSASVTPELCIERCQFMGFTYAGVENSDECYCGNEEQLLVDRRPESDCNNKCSGNNEEMCGGQWRLGLYEAGMCIVSKNFTSEANFLGCFKYDSQNTLTGYSFAMTDLTIQICVSKCYNVGYKYAGLHAGKQCLCGDNHLEYKMKVSEDLCNMNCNSGVLPCGGETTFNIYIADEQCSAAKAIETPKYLGCYVDNSNRILSGYSFTDSMTPEKCIKRCQDKGFVYAGVEYGGQCFCGNEEPLLAGRSPEMECDYKCLGNPTAKCGGLWRIGIYAAGECALIDSVGDEEIYLGCYLDQLNRKLNGFFYTNSAMTPAKCIATCEEKFFLYAGVQFHSQCFCGNTDPLSMDKKEDSECDDTCSGDKSKICGDWFRNSIYRAGNYVQKPAITFPDKNFLGCFMYDPANTLNGYKYTQDNITFKNCILKCQKLDYMYAGIHAGRDCLCGQNHMSVSMKVPDGECDINCNNDDIPCGGSDTLSLYCVDQHCDKVVLINATKYLGCYLDSSPRKLTGYSFSSNSMTPEKCIETCKQMGFIYAGVEYSSQCYCGNNEQLLENRMPEDDCSSKCSGDSKLICGGSWRYSLYGEGNSEPQLFDPKTIENSDYFLGCFKYDNDNSLNGYMYTSSETIELNSCALTCKAKGFLYTGVHAGKVCLCGNNHMEFNMKVNEYNCDMKCALNLVPCGGETTFNLYTFMDPCVKVESVDTLKYLGCYKDTMEHKLTEYSFSGKMTHAKCLDICRKGNYIYAAVEFSSQCLCGNEEQLLKDRALESECDYVCSDDPNNFCGGAWYFGLFESGVCTNTTNIHNTNLTLGK